MDWLKGMNDVLEFIEDNLSQPIQYESLSKIVGCSVYEFSRIFSFMAGMPISEYIRRRRLSQAVFDIQNGSEKIIDIEDCISKKVRVNTGERPQYYIENNHPAIIDSATFGRVQEELARRAGKRKVKQVGTKTEQGKYCGKYALTELLICGECGTPYRRCTWTVGGQKKIVWRCISRLDYGKKYCRQSPTMEEVSLQDAIMETILKTAKVNPEILQTLKMHIQMRLGCETQADGSIEIQIRIAQIDREFKEMLNSVTVQNQGSLLSDPRIESLITEKRMLENKLAQYSAEKEHRKNITSRLDEIFTVLEGMKNHPLTYDDQIVRQILQCVVVESKQKIKVVFIGGLEVECDVEQA